MLGTSTNPASTVMNLNASYTNNGLFATLTNPATTIMNLGLEAQKQQQQQAALIKRLKLLQRNEANKHCSECRSSKPKWIALMTTAALGHKQDERSYGVLCCEACCSFFLGLKDQGLCQLRSLKKPEEWTEFDLLTLEMSGNKAVNAVYEAKLKGNHSEQHKGSLASAAFLALKYGEAVFYCPDTFQQQMGISEWILAPGWSRKSLTTEDMVKKALFRQGSMKKLMSSPSQQAAQVVRRGSMRKMVSSSDLIMPPLQETKSTGRDWRGSTMKRVSSSNLIISPLQEAQRERRGSMKKMLSSADISKDMDKGRRASMRKLMSSSDLMALPLEIEKGMTVKARERRRKPRRSISLGQPMTNGQLDPSKVQDMTISVVDSVEKRRERRRRRSSVGQLKEAYAQCESPSKGEETTGEPVGSIEKRRLRRRRSSNKKANNLSNQGDAIEDKRSCDGRPRLSKGVGSRDLVERRTSTRQRVLLARQESERNTNRHWNQSQFKKSASSSRLNGSRRSSLGGQEYATQFKTVASSTTKLNASWRNLVESSDCGSTALELNARTS